MRELSIWILVAFIIGALLYYRDTHWDSTKQYQGEVDMEVAFSGFMLYGLYFVAVIIRLVWLLVGAWVN